MGGPRCGAHVAGEGREGGLEPVLSTLTHSSASWTHSDSPSPGHNILHLALHLLAQAMTVPMYGKALTKILS